MISAMTSAQILVLVLLAVLHVFAQAGNAQTDTSVEGSNTLVDKPLNTKHSEEHANTLLGKNDENLNAVIASFVKEWDTLYGEPKSRTKRWADLEKKPSYYYSSYSPWRSYSRFRYPSNLMALLRGTRGLKRSWMEEPRSTRWKYPSNLMLLLRGRRGSQMVDDEDDEATDLEKQAQEEVMRRLVEGWRSFLENFSKGQVEQPDLYVYED